MKKRKIFLIIFFFIALIILGILTYFLFIRSWVLSSAQRYLVVGESYLEKNQLSEALKSFKKAEALDSNNSQIHLRLGEIYLQANQFDKAEEEFRQTTRLDPKLVEGYLLGGGIYLKEKDYNQAEENFKIALNYKEDDKIYRYLGEVYLKKLDLIKASENLKRASEINSQNYEASYLLALVLLCQNSKEASRVLSSIGFSFDQNLQKQINLAKNYGEKILKTQNEIYKKALLSELFLKIGFFDLSLEYSQRVLRLNPQYRDGWLLSGKAHFYLGNYQEALVNFKKALPLDPVFGKTYFWLGKTYQKLDLSQLAENNFKKAQFLLENF